MSWHNGWAHQQALNFERPLDCDRTVMQVYMTVGLRYSRCSSLRNHCVCAEACAI